MELLTSILGGIVLLIVANVLLRSARSLRRNRSLRLPEGEGVVHEETGLTARIFTNQRLPGGLKPRVINRDRVSLRLSSKRLVVCSGAGRILEISPTRPGSMKTVGPDRLVIEGTHPSKQAALRVELVAPSAETWVAHIRDVGLQGAQPRRMP